MIPKKVDTDLKKFICTGFQLIKNSSKYSISEKKNLLNNLLAMGAGTGWQPIMITTGALNLFVENQFKLPKGLERAHLFHRRETLQLLLEQDWEDDSWWDWYKNRDYTVLSTRNENRDEKNFDNVEKYQIPRELNLFRGKRVGFEYGDEEKEFLKNLYKKIS